MYADVGKPKSYKTYTVNSSISRALLRTHPAPQQLSLRKPTFPKAGSRHLHDLPFYQQQMRSLHIQQTNYQKTT